MAKSLMKHSDLSCETSGGEEEVESVGCELEPLLLDIINTQNSQILDMMSVLEELGSEVHSDCTVEFLMTASSAASVGGSRFLADGDGEYEHSVECDPCQNQDLSAADAICIIDVKVNLFAGMNGTHEKSV